MAFTVEPLPGNHAFGAVIRNLNPADLDSPSVRQELNRLWIDKGVLIFRGIPGQRDIHLKLSRVFGDLDIHPNVEAHVPGYPELISLEYNPEDGDVYALGDDERGAYLPWHSDLVYVDRINHGGILRPCQLPSSGGQTGFVDQITAYATLPERLKARVDGLNVIYKANFDSSFKKFGIRPEKRQHSSINRIVQSRLNRFSLVVHPMVFTQEETGRKVLNVSPWFAESIEGMENAEGDALLAEIIAHCEDDALAYYHVWEQDDMVLWDNWRMLHSASGVPRNDRRTMERTTIKGDYELGRLAKGSGPIPDEQRVSI